MSIDDGTGVDPVIKPTTVRELFEHLARNRRLTLVLVFPRQQEVDPALLRPRPAWWSL